MNNLEAMTNAAIDGKVADFEASFNAEMNSRVFAAVNNVRAEVGASVKIDGEEVQD